MMKQGEFYIGYVDDIGPDTIKSVKGFIIVSLLTLIIGGLLFAFFQKTAINSSFDLGNPTKVSGIYHESPYPMLCVPLTDNEFKEVVLLGVGKFGPNAYLKEIRKKEGDIVGKQLIIEGPLIYYNGKTLLEINDSQKITLRRANQKKIPIAKKLREQYIEGEIVDPKCYFGVMKPGFGKIHRSCAALCISGGIPPVLVSKDKNGEEKYYLLTDLKGNAIHKDILPYIGRPSILFGEVSILGDWNILKIDLAQINSLNKKSSIF